MTHGQARVLFTKLSAELIVWVFSHLGWELSWSEGYVKDTDAADGDYDGPHMQDGAHYLGTGGDLNLFFNGVYITNSDHPVWRMIGEKWKSMHPLCRWGGDFKKPDGNHISVFFAGKA